MMRMTEQCCWLIESGRHAGSRCRNSAKEIVNGAGYCRWHARLRQRSADLTTALRNVGVVKRVLDKFSSS